MVNFFWELKPSPYLADYILSWEPGVPAAVVEAKVNTHTVSYGMQQVLGYAEILDVPSALSSNGDAFASHNKVPEPGEDIETQRPQSPIFRSQNHPSPASRHHSQTSHLLRKR